MTETTVQAHETHPAPEVRGKASSALLEIKEQIVKQGDDFFRAKITIPTVTSEAAGIEMHHARSQCLRASSKSSCVSTSM